MPLPSLTPQSSTDVFDTVVYAIGRTADTAGLNLDAAGLMANAKCVRVA